MCEVRFMDNKNILIGTLTGTAIVAGIGGMTGLKKGLETGAKMGFVAGVSTGVVGATVCLFAKKMIKRKLVSNVEKDV